MASVEHKITVMLSGNIYHIASLGINKTKHEIFYSPKSINKSLGWDLNHNKIGGTIDHFSFHKDGKIHAKFKEINRARKHPLKMSLYQEIGNFSNAIPGSPDIIRHILIDSIYQIDNKWFLQLAYDNPICELGNLNEFSVILVLMHDSRSAFDIFHCDEISQLQLQFSKKHLEIPFCDGWKIVVYITWQTLPKILPENISLYGLSFRPGKEQSFNRVIVTPSTPLAYQHLSFGRSIIHSNAFDSKKL